MLPDKPFRRDICESAKQGKLCCDDLCHDDECTCDITGEDGCPIHYPIDDGSDDDEES